MSLCWPVCWQAETRLWVCWCLQERSFPLAFHLCFPLYPLSVVWAAYVTWALIWSCSFSQMLEEHHLVKAVEQGTIKNEKYLFVGLEIQEKREESPSRSQDGGVRLACSCVGDHAAWGHVHERKSHREPELSSLLGRQTSSASVGWEVPVAPCCPWRSWGSQARRAQHQVPVSHSDLPTGRAAVWSGQGWADPRRLKAPVKWALPFCRPSAKKVLRQASAARFPGVWPGCFQHLGFPVELPSQRWAACPGDNPWSGLR